MITYFTLRSYIKSDHSSDSRITFQTEIQRHLHLIKETSNIPIDWQEPTPGQITEKQLQLHFPQQMNKIEYGRLDELIGLACISPTIYKEFIWGYRLFVSTQEVLFQFLQRFEIATSINCSLSKIIKARIVSILSYWSTTILPLLPEKEKQDALKLFHIFLQRMKDYGMKKQVILLENQMRREVIVFLSPENVNNKIRLPFSYLLNQNKFKFIEIPFKDFSEQLTYITSYYFRSIKLFELFLWNKCHDECKTLLKCIKVFNAIQNFFAIQILNKKNIFKRCKILQHIIDIAYYCYTLQNYNIVVCIVSLFSTSAIHRLHKTFNNISSLHKNKFNELIEKKLEEVKHTACVPYIGLFLSDMLFTTDGIKTQTEDKLINFIKCQKLSAIAQNVLSFQQKLYPFNANPILQKYLLIIFNANEIEENDKFELSRKIEPQNGKEKVIEIYDNSIIEEYKIKERNDLIKISFILKGIKRVFYVNEKVSIRDLLINWIGLKENDLEQKRIVIIKKQEIINISLFTILSDIQNKYLQSKNIITKYIRIRNINYELNIPLDTSLTMNELIPIISILFDMEINHCFIHLLNGKPDNFITMNLPLYEYITNISTILLLPYSSFTKDLKDSFLSSSYFYHYQVSSNNLPLQIVHAHPFIILKSSSLFHIFHLSSIQLIYLPLLDELHLITKNDIYTKNHPLVITCSRELSHQLITLYHQSPALCGISVEYLLPNSYGLHKLFFSLCEAIYLHPSFYNNNFFSNFDVSTASNLLRNCELGNNIDLFSASSSELVGALFLYLSSLEAPLFGHLSDCSCSSLVHDSLIDAKSLISISQTLLKSVEGTMSLSIIHALLILFNSWVNINPSNISSLGHFSKFFINEINPDNQLRLFNYLILHLDDLDLKPIHPIPFPSAAPHNLSADYIIQSIFNEIDYKPMSAISILEHPYNETRTLLMKQNSFQKLNLTPPRIRSIIRIGDRKNSNQRLVHNMSESLNLF
ncbi:Ras guanine nucleotide exchange factor putative [Entamoeba histolytica]|nr:Ras guanine nucleotide exchange factor putative [Entamoeba histolytica]